MKRIILLILCSAAMFGASAQSADKINIGGISVRTDEERDSVEISFTAAIDRKAAKNGMTIVFAPVITDGQYKVSFPAIVVQSQRSKRNWQRHEWAADTQAVYENGIYTSNGSTIDYKAKVPFQPWMHEARIEAEMVTAGCCNADIELLAMAGSVLPAPIPEPEVIVPEQSVTEFLAQAFPFVLPAAEFDENEPIKFYNDERDNALTVYYKLNRYDIEKDYAGNEQTLINLIAAIKLIRESGDADVRRVVVAGFASPEGPAELNDKLAWERAVSIKEYIMKNTNMPDSDIRLFNGSADWNGLRRLIAADNRVPGQAEALDVIDRHPIWNTDTQTGRMTHLRALRGGDTYRYLKEHIFPKLRNGAFIRVYFEEK